MDNNPLYSALTAFEGDFGLWKANSTSEPYLAGVYITASHNPAEYNGIRFRHPDGTGYTKGNIEIKKIFFEEELVETDVAGKINIHSTGIISTISTMVHNRRIKKKHSICN